MLIGKRFELKRSVMVLDTASGRRVAITVPVSAILKVTSEPSGEDNRMVDVMWENRVVAMFAIDLNARGMEIPERSTEAEGDGPVVVNTDRGPPLFNQEPLPPLTFQHGPGS